MVESFVQTELRRMAAVSRTHPRMHFFRSHAGREVDFLLERSDGAIVAVEVRSASTVTTSDFRGMEYVQRESSAPFIRGIVLYNGTEVVPFGKQLAAVPLPMLRM